MFLFSISLGDKDYSAADQSAPSPRVVKFFKPTRPPGIQISNLRTRSSTSSLTRAVDFFKLFFTLTLVEELCGFSNAYAILNASKDRGASYLGADGNFAYITPDEMYSYIALLIYMGFVQLPSIDRYWSTKTLYHGTWARAFMSKNRFKAINCFLHVSDPTQPEDDNDPLAKVRFLVDHIKKVCSDVYQPFQNVSIDERMVRSKGRFKFRMYIRDKPTKFGFKLWVLADSKNGYTCHFDIYTGRKNTEKHQGLAFDVVIKLTQTLTNQGYHLYCDNFYTSHHLFRELKGLGILACGTALCNRRNFPEHFKKTVKSWGRKAKRGNMRWQRSDDIVTLQWKDNKVVTIVSTIHGAPDATHTLRRVKEDGRFSQKIVRQPVAVRDYNRFMNGVDRSDQLIGRYDILRKTVKWWKTLFYHMIDIAVVNSYILFRLFQTMHPNNVELQRSSDYGQLEFREELVRQLAGIVDGPVPLYNPKTSENAGTCLHIPQHMPDCTRLRRNCQVCYKKTKTEYKVSVRCETCDVYLHCNSDKNCYKEWHTPAFQSKYIK